jgi:hypothetical protein
MRQVGYRAALEYRIMVRREASSRKFFWELLEDRAGAIYVAERSPQTFKGMEEAYVAGSAKLKKRMLLLVSQLLAGLPFLGLIA